MSDTHKPNPMDPVEISRDAKPNSDSASASKLKSKTHLAVNRRYHQLRKKRYSVVVFFLLTSVLALVITVGVFQAIQSKRKQASVKVDDAETEPYVSPGISNQDLDDMSPVLKQEQPFANAPLNRPRNVDADLVLRPSDPGNDSNREESSDGSIYLARLHKILRDAKKAIADRRFKTAKLHIAEAESIVGSNQVQRIQIESVDVMCDYAQQFWAAFDEGISKLEGSEIEIDGERMYVVECDEQKIIIRRQGKNISLDREELSSKMTLKIAERGFDNSAPSTKVFKGVFMFVNSDFSDHQVRTIWQEAANEGVDISGLLPLLDR